MRIISKRMLSAFWTKHPTAKEPLEVWYQEAKSSIWSTPQDIKQRFPRASFLPKDRVVFDIKGNSYRLVTYVRYPFQLVYLRFLGTHAEYDKIDATTI